MSRQVGIFDAVAEVRYGGDGESEQVAEASGVAAGCLGFVADAVSADGVDAAGVVDGDSHPSAADGFEALVVAEVDEQVRVYCLGPASGPVGEVGVGGLLDGFGEGDGAGADVEATVVEVDQSDVAELAGVEPVVDRKCDDGGTCRVGVVEIGIDPTPANSNASAPPTRP